jgi:hypothetical protein
MAKLYRIESLGELVKIEEKLFSSEKDEMEPLIKKNPQLIGDFIIFGEQIISPNRDKITDLLAVNKDGEILIVELKKGTVNKDVISQVLEYRTFWKKSLETARNLWNEYKNKPVEDIKPDWDNYNPKIVIVGSAFDDELIEMISANELPIELIEISRYEHEKTFFIVVKRIESREISIAPMRSQKEYNWDWYLEAGLLRNQKEADFAKHICDEIIKLSEANKWDIQIKFNKWYVAFKYGFHKPFWLEFRHVGKISIGVNLRDKNDDPSKKSPQVKWEWDKNWENWYTEIDNPNFDINIISNILLESYNSTAGL